MVKERLKALRKELGFTQEQLAKYLGIGKAALSMIETGKAGLSKRNQEKLVKEFNINSEWLECGRGKMFNTTPEMRNFVNPTDTPVSLQSVPLYSIEGGAKLSEIVNINSGLTPLNYIHIPNLTRCDGAISIVGDSMYPLLKGGDIVMYKEVTDYDNIFWGDMHLLSIDMDGEEIMTVKYVEQSERTGYVKLTGENKRHGEKEILKSKIKALAIIKASIRMNTI